MDDAVDLTEEPSCTTFQVSHRTATAPCLVTFRRIHLVEVSVGVKIAGVDCFYDNPEAFQHFFSWRIARRGGERRMNRLESLRSPDERATSKRDNFPEGGDPAVWACA
jgi:hypothetical protein